jgi:hypothetical protein
MCPGTPEEEEISSVVRVGESVPRVVGSKARAVVVRVDRVEGRVE